MLKAMMAGLLSMTALVPPALAQDGRSMDRGQWQRERPERPTPPPEPAVRPAPAAPAARASEPAPRRWERDGATPDRRGADRWGRDDRRQDALPRPPAPNGDWRSSRAAEPREAWQRDPYRDQRGDVARRAPDRDWTAEPGRRRYDRREGPTPPAAIWRSERDGRWDRAWRREPRYDWSRYRDERRSAFRLPRYYAPYGWSGGYRRFGIGMPLAPMLYTPRYWIYDPYTYRLPDAEEPYRWVRYYDDALLVDIEDGTVVDVIHGIFE